MIFPAILIVLGTVFFALRDASHSLPVLGVILYIMAGRLADKLPAPKEKRPPRESPRMAEARRRRELIRKARERP